MREPKQKLGQPGRPREFDEVEALSKIMQLFWENGYEATGLADILKATGLGKASLYAAYGNKHTMYLKALTQYDSLMVESAVQALCDSGRPASDRLKAFLSAPLEAVRQNNDRRGCFLCNAAADRSALDTDTAALVRSGYAKMQAGLETVIAELDTSLTNDQVANNAALALTVYSGLRVMARSSVPDIHLLAGRDACLNAVLTCAPSRPI